MLRRIGNISLIPSALWYQNKSRFDTIENEKEYPDKESETGWDRVKKIFKPDEFGDLMPESQMILNVGCMSAFIGALYGGVTTSKVAYMEFMRTNQATAFESHFEAKKRLQDKVTLSFGKGAWRWGWRLTLFSTTYTAVSTMISVYRDKTGLVEYVAAGAITGFMYKFNMGPRGWIVGSGLGTVLGLIAGGTTLGLLKLSGLTMHDVRKFNADFEKNRHKIVNEGVAKYLEKEEEQLLLDHNKQLGEKIINVETVNKPRNVQ